ncbi:MAG: (2Fe-2S)-binding protein [Gemmatimonadota bacterium]
MAEVTIAVNGVSSSHSIQDRMLLVHYLRDVLRLTGTHVGCDTSQCGACTVLLDGVAVKSCTVLAAQADGSHVATIEGMGTPAALHALQQAFREEHGLQCGFCTPGVVMAAADMLRRNPSPTEEQVRSELGGNLCRCTGYHNIVKAILRAAEQMRSEQQSPARAVPMAAAAR